MKIFVEDFLYIQAAFLVFDLVSIVTGGSRNYVFRLRDDLGNSHSSQDLQFDESGKSLLRCAHLCVQSVYCLSIFFNEDSGECTGHDVIYTSINSPGIISKLNFSYWEVERPYDKAGCVPMTSSPGYCIKLHPEYLLVNEQITECTKDRMDLASLTTTAKHQFVQNYLLGIGHSSAVGVSAYKSTGSWLWTDGSTVDAAVFGPGEPTNNAGEECGLLAAATGFQLNDALCSNPRSFLCDRTIYK